MLGLRSLIPALLVATSTMGCSTWDIRVQDAVILHNTIKNAGQITGPGVAEEISNRIKCVDPNRSNHCG